MGSFLTTDQIRQRWIDFFVRKGHQHVAADSLVPANDPSILFTGAGMNQFKEHFAGIAKLDHPRQRAVTVQPCVRTSDIDNVGRTPSHHACFEMLGNFSFGDYFKEEAIQWAVEFLSDPEQGLGMDTRRLSVTVYSGDEKLGIPKDSEAIEAWKRHAPWLKDERAPQGWRIYEYGEHDNFWPADAPSKGPNGPCGPCSEIYYDMDPHWETDLAKVPPPAPVAEDGIRYCEIWNLVFTQYDRKEGGRLDPLPNNNIDTGAGLERMARVLQKKKSNFDNDLLRPICEQVGRLAGKTYGQDAEDSRRMRRIADHVRFAVLAISDGVHPKNEGRNYVVRRLMRRAIVDGQELDIRDPFLIPVADAVLERMKTGYPQLEGRMDFVRRVIQEEERAFTRTLSQGRQHFEDVIKRLRAAQADRVPGKDAFMLWDTYGFPLELTKESAQGLGLMVDEEGFEKEMAEAVRTSRAGSGMATEIFTTGPVADLGKKYAGRPTVFEGYTTLSVEKARVLALIQDDRLVDSVQGGSATVLLDRTPFYAESGGQVGDRGSLTGPDGTHLVIDTRKFEGLFLHQVEAHGTIKVNETVKAQVAPGHRAPIIRNHSATHLLQHALRERLGEHVEQRGSLVAPDRLRFDFTHFEAVTDEQIQAIEQQVNDLIQDDAAVSIEQKALAEAKASGARALFGEKYGNEVRVVSMGPSMELCGGTHCERTGQIGYFRIVSESAIAAGVRRMEALTGRDAVVDAQKCNATITALAGLVKSHRDELPDRIRTLQNEKTALERELSALKKKAVSAAADELLAQVKDVSGAKLLAVPVEDADAQTLRGALDSIRRNLKEGAVVLGGHKDGKVSLLVSLSKDVVERGGHAGMILKEIAPKVGGKGGGKPDMAQGGGRDATKLPDALAAAEAVLAGMLK